MNKNYRISVIIPTYNSQKSIKQCIDSVYSSSYPVKEVIVVDDCSSDKTTDVVKNLGVILIRNDTHRFQAASRNKGAGIVNGGLLLFIDSDIVLKSDAIKSAVESMAETGASAVVGMCSPFNPYDNTFSQYKHLYMVFNQLGSKPWIQWTNTSFLLISKKPSFP